MFIIEKTLVAFDEDNLIPCFGFEDVLYHHILSIDTRSRCFSFYPDLRFCNGFEEVLRRYKEIVPHLRLAGPTYFAPIVEMEMTIIKQSGGQYHVLVIITDGKFSLGMFAFNSFSSFYCMRFLNLFFFFCDLSKLLLSIILVRVRDGPWDTMKEFDGNIPIREFVFTFFSSFLFMNFTEIMSKNFNKGNVLNRVPLPPPLFGESSSSGSKLYHSSSTFNFFFEAYNELVSYLYVVFITCLFKRLIQIYVIFLLICLISLTTRKSAIG
ncbi:hypothetical protein K2173_028040 [Erythroxylum novogranatense]|uniref:Copine C-terminal domain-containing protein n=1 Tax=Erythroxylum novogranatense TaxID=1862640 RepID=A0AAV8U4N9_9ROSI|nr:hypothetical protein K2173_028040 [Erythroxylum novogranatense]